MRAHRFTIALTALLIVAGILPASAPADLGLNVSPAKMELSMAPGTTYNIPVTVQNSTNAPTHIQAQLVDFALTQSGDYHFGQTGSDKYSLMRWATINPREFDLPANSTQQVRLTLTIPKISDLAGEYAGIAFFQTRPVRRAGAVALSARIGSKFYLTIPNTVKLDGAISKMSVGHGPFGEVYRVLYKNLGNAHQYLNGQIQVRKGGSVVQTIAMERDMLVERGGSRLIEANGNSSLPPGKYEIIAVIDYGGKTQTGGEIIYDKK
jgi:hypothetical protein